MAWKCLDILIARGLDLIMSVFIRVMALDLP
jgi:hypothetical protein